MTPGDPFTTASASAPTHVSTDSPGIRFPPTLIFFVGIGVGALVDHFVPSTLGPGALRAPIGVLLFIAGAMLLSNATALFKSTSNDHLRLDRPAASLVTTGPYIFSRNPMYLAFSCVYASAALVGNNAWTLLLLPPCMLVLQAKVIAAEEAYLTRAFGSEYLEYCTKVRRWL